MGKFLLIAAVTYHTAKWVGAPYHFVTGMGATFWIAVAVLLVIGFLLFRLLRGRVVIAGLCPAKARLCVFRG